MFAKKIVYNKKIYYINIGKLIKNILFNEYDILSEDEELLWKVKKNWKNSLLKDTLRITAYLFLLYCGYLLMINNPIYYLTNNIFTIVLNIFLLLVPFLVFEFILIYFFTPIEVINKKIKVNKLEK